MELRSTRAMLEIIFETHSISLDNERGIATGWNDGALSESGKRAAMELGLRHRALPPSVVFTSDLGRAVETADIAFAAHDSRSSGTPGCESATTASSTGSRRASRSRTSGAYQHTLSRGQATNRSSRRWTSSCPRSWSVGRETRVVLIGHSATRWALDSLVNGVPLEESVISPFHWQPGWRY